MSDKDKDLAGPPRLAPDEPAYGTLPPKALEKLFGVDTILRNLDDPTDGVFEVIKDKKGDTLCIRNPRSKRWLRYEKGTAQRLLDDAQNSVAVDTPTLLPVPIETRTSGRKRKSVDYSEQNDVGETAQAVVKKTAQSVVKETAQAVVKETAQAVVKETAQAVVKKTAEAVKQTAVDRVRQKKDARKRWRVAGAAVRYSLRIREQEASSHTGLSLEFDRMDV